MNWWFPGNPLWTWEFRPLTFKILLESDPLKSRSLVRKLAVLENTWVRNTGYGFLRTSMLTGEYILARKPTWNKACGALLLQRILYPSFLPEILWLSYAAYSKFIRYAVYSKHPLELWICSNLSKSFIILVPTVIGSDPVKQISSSLRPWRSVRMKQLRLCMWSLSSSRIVMPWSVPCCNAVTMWPL